MQFKRLKRAPVILVLLVLALVGGLQLSNPDFFDRLERMTYDLRVRTAQKFPAPTATNLAFVSMEDSSIAAIRHGLLGRPYGLYWPRHVYGRLVEELSALHLAWEGAFATTAQADAPLAWHERFTLARARLADWVSKTGCRPGAHRS